MNVDCHELKDIQINKIANSFYNQIKVNGPGYHSKGNIKNHAPSDFILHFEEGKKNYQWLYFQTSFQIHLLFLLEAIFMNDYILMPRRWDIYSFIPHLTNHLVAFNRYQGMGTS